LEQAGFYVDIDDALDVIAPAIEFSEAWFKTRADDADDALQMAKSEPIYHETMAAIYINNRFYKTTWAVSSKKRSKLVKKIVEIVEDLKPYLMNKDGTEPDV
jgi:hypothetical protein